MIARSLLLLLAATLPPAAGVGAVYGAGDGLLTAALLLGLGGTSLAVAHAVARRRARLGSLRRQFALGVIVAVGQLLVAVAIGAWLMFVSPHDVLFVLVITAASGVVAARAAQLLAHGAMADIDALRDTLVAVGEGSRRPTARTDGNDELAVLAEAANATIVKLGQSERARHGLVSAVSHDLRAPITALQLLAQAVDDDIVDAATRRRYLRQMGTHVRALAALIDDLFEISRLQAGELEWTLQRVLVAELVDETVEAMRVEAEAKRVRVTTALVEPLALVRADPEKLQRVLFNLIQNAIRHTPADGSVIVLAEAVGQGVEIEVADTGDGISATDRPRVFEPFYRGGGEAARTRPGAGLGLAIARAIVEGHGGRIWLEDAPRGTRVRLWLPRPADLAPGAAARGAAPVNAPASVLPR